MAVWEHRATHSVTVRAHGCPQQLHACVRQENPEGPMLLLRSGPASGGAAALCDPLLRLFLRNYLTLALKGPEPAEQMYGCLV